MLQFQPTLPARGATAVSLPASPPNGGFQPTLPARGATRTSGRHPCGHPAISTHAPRTGSDFERQTTMENLAIFQPTLPARGATPLGYGEGVNQLFQPTLPARGATNCSTMGPRFPIDFNPRSPHGERHGDAGGKRAEFAISTHAPRTGSDADDFLLPRQQGISTHAPRTGSDRAQLVRADGHLTISTHAPRTGSDSGSVSGASITATISTHAPRTGSDLARMRVSMPRHSMNFNPRSPHGERHYQFASIAQSDNISTHAPRTGSDDAIIDYQSAGFTISTHAPRTGSDTTSISGLNGRMVISTHAPRTGSDCDGK